MELTWVCSPTGGSCYFQDPLTEMFYLLFFVVVIGIILLFAFRETDIQVNKVEI